MFTKTIRNRNDVFIKCFVANFDIFFAGAYLLPINRSVTNFLICYQLSRERKLYSRIAVKTIGGHSDAINEAKNHAIKLYTIVEGRHGGCDLILVVRAIYRTTLHCNALLADFKVWAKVYEYKYEEDARPL